MIPRHYPWIDGWYITIACLIPSWLTEPIFVWFDHYTHSPTLNGIKIIQDLVNESDVVAAHNLKYDLNILRFLGINFDKTKLHCTMVADYLLFGQNTEKYDFNLNAVCERRGLPKKLDVVKIEYWDKGIETFNVPEEILLEYVLDDTKKVEEITDQQLKEIYKIQKVYDLQMEFILSLSDMESNGLLFDCNKAKSIVSENSDKLNSYYKRLLEIAEEPRLNLNSGEQLSALLFGGVAKVAWEEWVIQEYKTQPYSRYYEKTFTEDVILPGLGFTPLPKTELKKQGYYSTDKNTIKQLKCKTKIQKEVKEILLDISKISKVIETLQGKTDNSGLLNKVQKDGKVHPNLNQTVTKTGRLSSSEPNGQNLPRGNTSPIKQCILSEN